MPNRDGTGPAGKGLRTGKGMGRCKKEKQKNKYYAESGIRRGAGQGMGAGQEMD